VILLTDPLRYAAYTRARARHDGRPPSPPSGGTPEEREALREFNVREADSAWKAVAYLITGPAIYGGLGWLLDRWWGTSFMTPVGIVGGMALSIYLIWFRYGSH